jgi:hypothetical protein
MNDDKIVSLFGDGKQPLVPGPVPTSEEDKEAAKERMLSMNKAYAENLRNLAAILEDEENPIKFEGFMVSYITNTGDFSWLCNGLAYAEILYLLRYVDYTISTAAFGRSQVLFSDSGNLNQETNEVFKSPADAFTPNSDDPPPEEGT